MVASSAELSNTFSREFQVTLESVDARTFLKVKRLYQTRRCSRSRELRATKAAMNGMNKN